MAYLLTGNIIDDVREDNKFARLNYLKKPINVAALGLSSTINAMSILCGNQMLGLSLFLSAASLASLITQYFTYYDSYEEKCFDEFVEKLHQIPEYQEAIYLYKSYIRDLVSYIDLLGLKEPLDICLYCKLMMEDGYFSYHHNHQYRDYDFVAPCDYRLLGGRVFTGTSVCRHMATFFNDVLKETGAVTTPLLVRCYNEKDASKKIFRKKKPDHLIVGIKTPEGKFAYDPTNGVTATIDKEHRLTGWNGEIIKGVLSKNYYLVSTKKQYSYRMGQKDDAYDEYNRASYIEFKRQELINKRRAILKQYAENEFNNDYFYKYEHARITAIANYQELLCPERSGKEFKW